METRGIRNFNPGNIRKGTIAWRGLAVVQSDPDFCVFSSPEYGVRAIARILISYQDRSGCDTVRKVISRWAPPNENRTEAYIDDVARRASTTPDAPVDILKADVMLGIVKAIIQHENGVQPYSDALLLVGIEMAGVPAPQEA